MSTPLDVTIKAKAEIIGGLPSDPTKPAPVEGDLEAKLGDAFIEALGRVSPVRYHAMADDDPRQFDLTIGSWSNAPAGGGKPFEEGDPRRYDTHALPPDSTEPAPSAAPLPEKKIGKDPAKPVERWSFPAGPPAPEPTTA